MNSVITQAAAAAGPQGTTSHPHKPYLSAELICRGATALVPSSNAATMEQYKA